MIKYVENSGFMFHYGLAIIINNNFKDFKAFARESLYDNIKSFLPSNFGKLSKFNNFDSLCTSVICTCKWTSKDFVH